MNVDNNAHHGVERYAYCLCLHVRPGTIFVALVNLGGSLICAIVSLVLMAYGENPMWQHMTESQRSTATTLAIVMYMMLSAVSAMLLYGVLKSRPSYILPFFGIQFIDFLFTLPQFLTSLYSHPSNYHMDRSQAHGNSGLFDMKHVWPNASPNNVYTSSLLFTTLIILFKCYFLCVVWKCYRYLRMKEMILLPIHMPYHTTNDVNLMVPPLLVPPPNIAPPGYDEATKSYAPPDYESATKNDELKYVPVTPPQQQCQQQCQTQQNQPLQESQSQNNNNKSEGDDKQ